MRLNPFTRPRSRGQDTQARMMSLGEQAVRDLMRELEIGERRACAELERQRGLQWQQSGQMHVPAGKGA